MFGYRMFNFQLLSVRCRFRETASFRLLCTPGGIMLCGVGQSVPRGCLSNDSLKATVRY